MIPHLLHLLPGRLVWVEGVSVVELLTDPVIQRHAREVDYVLRELNRQVMGDDLWPFQKIAVFEGIS